MAYHHFGYNQLAIFSSLFKLMITKIFNTNKYSIPIKNIICEKKACIHFPCNIKITHLVPPHAGHNSPVVWYIQQDGIHF